MLFLCFDKYILLHSRSQFSHFMFLIKQSFHSLCTLFIFIKNYSQIFTFLAPLFTITISTNRVFTTSAQVRHSNYLVKISLRTLRISLTAILSFKAPPSSGKKHALSALTEMLSDTKLSEKSNPFFADFVTCF